MGVMRLNREVSFFERHVAECHRSVRDSTSDSSFFERLYAVSFYIFLRILELLKRIRWKFALSLLELNLVSHRVRDRIAIEFPMLSHRGVDFFWTPSGSMDFE